MQVAANMEEIDSGLQRLEEILREEQDLLLIRRLPSLSSPTKSVQNEASLACTLNEKLNAALSKSVELEHAAAQSQLMTKAAMAALRESQSEMLKLREEFEALQVHADRGAEMSVQNSQLQREVDSLKSALEESQRATDALLSSIAAKDFELQNASSRCSELEAAAAFVAPAEVSRLTLQLRMRDETILEASRISNNLVASMDQSIVDVKRQLDDALCANLALSTEWKARYDQKCNEYLETINSLQETIKRNCSPPEVTTEHDRLHVALQGSSNDASALNRQVSDLLRANAQLKQQLDALTLSSPAPVYSAASLSQGSFERARGIHMYALEVHALKRELADVRARANSVEPKDDGLARATPAFFITERQYSLLVEENAHLMQTNAQLEQHVATLKEQLHASIRSQQQRISKADDMRHAALDALYEFCVGLGQRLSSIELAIVQQLQSNDQ